MEPINHNISSKELRKFGLITAGLFIIFFGLLLPWIFSAKTLPLWPWVFSCVLAVWALLHPLSLKYFYIPWMMMANILGWINSHIILSVLFFCLIFPVGIILRLMKKDPMNRKQDPSIKSYKTTVASRDKSHMERPY